MINNTQSDLVASTVEQFFEPEIDGNLVRNFFVFFARFEYALKREGVLKGDDKSAGVDWDCYAKRVRGLFEPTTSSSMTHSLGWLLKNPPQKQVVLNGQLRFAPVTKDESESEASYILRLVRTVRNNLFHGGKFPEPCGPIAETSRDQHLLRAAMNVLQECARDDAPISQWLRLDN